MVKYLKSLLVFPFICCFASNVFADGCALNYNTANEVIYYGLINAATKNFGSPVAYNNANPAYQTACPKYNFNTAVTDGQSCRINGVINSAYRYIPSFTFIACPIDDYLPLLLLSAGFMGFFVIRSKANINILNF